MFFSLPSYPNLNDHPRKQRPPKNLPKEYYCLNFASCLLLAGASFFAHKKSFQSTLFCLGLSGSCFLEADKIQKYIHSRHPLPFKFFPKHHDKKVKNPFGLSEMFKK